MFCWSGGKGNKRKRYSDDGSEDGSYYSDEDEDEGSDMDVDDEEEEEEDGKKKKTEGKDNRLGDNPSPTVITRFSQCTAISHIWLVFNISLAYGRRLHCTCIKGTCICYRGMPLSSNVACTLL